MIAVYFISSELDMMGRMKTTIGVDGETSSFVLKVNSNLAKSLSSRLLHKIEGREGAEQKLSP